MDYTILTKKISYFKENKIPVHIILTQQLTLQSGVIKNKIHNGLILEFSGDMIILDEDIHGAIPIYLIEIKDIEKRMKKE